MGWVVDGVLFDVFREFVTLTGRVGVKSSESRVKELMIMLRRAGLTSPQIVALSGGKMSDTLVRQYTAGWGGVDDSLVTELDVLIAPLRELVLSGRGVGDVKADLALDRSVKAKGSSLEEVAELNTGLRELDVKPGEIKNFVEMSRELREKHLTPGVVSGWMAKDDELTDLGFDRSTRDILLKGCKEYGGIVASYKAAMAYGHMSKILEDELIAQARLNEIRKASFVEQTTYNSKKEANEALATVFALGWTLISLTFAADVLRRANTPERRNALSKHLNQFEWYRIPEGEERLVKSSKVWHDPVEMVKTFQELWKALDKVQDSDDQLINFTNLLMEKLPGITLSDYANIILKVPDVSEQKKKTANYFIQLEEVAVKSETSNDSDMLKAMNNWYKVQIYENKEKLEKLKKMYPSAQQQAAYEILSQLVNGIVPPDLNLRDVRVFFIKMLKTYSSMVQTSSESTDSEKSFFKNIHESFEIYEKVDLLKGKDPTN